MAKSGLKIQKFKSFMYSSKLKGKIAEAYSEPSQTSMMELSAVDYFHKHLHLRCSTEYRLRLWVGYFGITLVQNWTKANMSMNGLKFFAKIFLMLPIIHFPGWIASNESDFYFLYHISNFVKKVYHLCIITDPQSSVRTENLHFDEHWRQSKKPGN